MEKLIGRDKECDYVILDPQRRVSRKHAIVKVTGNEIQIKDFKSLNGTYINGKKLAAEVFYPVTRKDKITLSTNYILDLDEVVGRNNDATQFIPSNNGDCTILFSAEKAVFNDGARKVSLDPEKTTIGELSGLDNSPFKKIGRDQNNDFVVKDSNVSRNHCRIRMITPQLIELEDLSSSNGTFADQKRVEPGKLHRFSTAVQISLGTTTILNLKEIFPQIQIIKKEPVRSATSPTPQPGAPITQKELDDFLELEIIFKEYNERFNKANKTSNSLAIAGTALGLVAAVFTGGFGGIIFSQGGSLLGRWLGQRTTNEVKNDVSYEEMFLQTYCCPRCKESFQKKPWITIRDCFKCKIKFR
jgi:pSer/pThr/pTyr-binding forkhead associated (FHA) protein